MPFISGSNNNAYQAIPSNPNDVEMTKLNEAQAESSAPFQTLREEKRIPWKTILGSFAILAVISFAAISFTSNKPIIESNVGGKFDSFNRYIVRDFDLSKPMSNFLNGLGGLWGIPMWVFYVNRGQGITSFGRQNKDNAIAKFLTAEKAYQQTPFTGFRTFLKGTKNGATWHHMPFFPRGADSKADLSRNMMIGLNEMEIEEVNKDLALKTNILYFTIPGQDFPALVRSTTFTNLDPSSSLEVEVLDGLAKLLPNGLNNNAIDSMGRTSEAWMNVYNVGSAADGGAIVDQPFFHISQDTADSAQVRLIKDGYFTLSFIDNGEKTEVDSTGLAKLLPFVVDPMVIFDTDTTLTNPTGFFQEPTNIDDLVKSPQATTSQTPCSFSGTKLVIPPGTNVTISTVYGYAENLETLVGKYGPIVRTPGFLAKARDAANTLVEDITKRVETKTSSPIFDAYVKQDFLDNFLRGGLPITLGKDDNTKVFHVYSRIHGDIERDYNYFQIDTSYFSQGPGNFRDVCQNRRVDTFHSPFVGDFSIHQFLSFIQSDGYNPLTVASVLFKVLPEKMESVLDGLKITPFADVKAARNIIKGVLGRPYRPGQLFRDFKSVGIEFEVSKEEALNVIVSGSTQEVAGQFAQNGYWADHWTYILDLLDNYLAIFPDREAYELWDSGDVPFFMSPAIVRSRIQRYVPVDNPAHPGSSVVRSYSAIATPADPDYSKAKAGAFGNIYTDPNFIADPYGAGGLWQRDQNQTVFKVSPLAKFLILGIIKFSTMDPYGVGIEMEGGKPGWNDAMNGLPGILGSGMPETYEMLRIIRYTKSALSKFGRDVQFPVEFVDFLTDLNTALDAYGSSSKDLSAEFTYWDASNTARENYRAKVVAYFDGTKVSVSAAHLVDILSKIEAKANSGIQRAVSGNNGISPTYFYYECSDFTFQQDPTNPSHNGILAKSFNQKSLPLFLEGPTRHLKVVDKLEDRKNIYNLVRNSPLYDAPLKMYTICESLATMGQDLGRMKAFSPGWLENQSVWLHMSYKFYLELLRGGLYEEFFSEIATGLVPFMDDKVYGRSPLEAASFIASSAFPNKKLHGSSFLARLSGSTAELLSMWTYMMAGPSPFSLNSEGKLQLTLSPILPAWLFDDENKVSFTFLGSVQVTYVNPSRVDTWKTKPTHAQVVTTDGQVIDSSDVVLSESIALLVRNGKAKSVTISF